MSKNRVTKRDKKSIYNIDVEVCYTGSKIDKIDFVQMLVMMKQLPNNTAQVVQLLQSLSLMALVEEAGLYQQALWVLMISGFLV